ncbi:ROK family transcriptional regulator [Donghicola sp. C2-DW-16]|uniref:ROK family transcriptional regulator n=1 Tax=Donghicola mangrovi TaxID=2729614 RepID=A0ABX2PH32_9RHOB|nr:ROK family transcriptional regulator [Donghicola mangrovi]NVO28808.1 ROK family transcriptional regulator [Donghicola mangrovi]
MDSQTFAATGNKTVGRVRGSNQTGVRAHNERLVLTLIRQHGPLAKAEIARLTGLSAQTVSVIMRSLEADGLLTKGEPVRGKVGQPSVPIKLRQDGAFFLGLKVGRRSLDLVLTDFLGVIRSRVHLTHRFPTPDGTVMFANHGIAQLLDQLSEEERGRIAGMGIAVPFRLWDWAKSLGLAPDAMDDWRTRDIRAEIESRCDFPVFLQNDASAACSAEVVFGEADGRPDDFLYFFIGFFVGGGLVLDNTVYTGKTGNAGAVGSVPIAFNGTRLTQLVDVASLSCLENAMVEQGLTADAIWANPQSWSVPQSLIDTWIEDASEGLAYAIASASSLIDFGCVMIDGWMPEDIREELVKRTQDKASSLNTAGIELPHIQAGTIGSDARALGAASLPLSERFLVDRNALMKG